MLLYVKMSRHAAFFGNVVSLNVDKSALLILTYMKSLKESVCKKKMISMLTLKVGKVCFIYLETGHTVQAAN